MPHPKEPTLKDAVLTPSPYALGRKAYEAGLPRLAMQYKPGSDDAMDFCYGWEDAYVAAHGDRIDAAQRVADQIAGFRPEPAEVE